MKKETVKSAINVAAVLLVPLINERHRIKQHPEVQKMSDYSSKAFDNTKHVAIKTKDKTVHATHKVTSAVSTVKNTTVDTAQFVNRKAHETKKKHDYNQQMKQHHKQEKLEQKEEKQLQKEMNKLDHQLSKNIERRIKEEDKAVNEREKALKQEMKQYKNYAVDQSAKEQKFAPAQPKKLTRKDQKAIHQLAKKLEQSIEARHAAEEKANNANRKAMIKEMKQYKNYKIKTPGQKRSIFGLKRDKLNVQNDRVHQAFTPNDTISAKVSAPTQKANSKTVEVEENYDNAKTFELHRQLMAEHIAKR